MVDIKILFIRIFPVAHLYQTKIKANKQKLVKKLVHWILELH